jgi:hypothetical protein
MIMLAYASFGAARQSQDQAATPAAKPAASTTKHKTSSKTASSSSGKSSNGKTKSASSHTASSGKRSSPRKKSAKARGQQKIDSERAQEIQEALIREHYLTGEATGTWNQSSEDAMRRFQADQGWQTKQVPDSRALIKLGLGPNKDHLLNPESAMTTVPDSPRASSLPASSTTSAPESTAPSPAPAAANPNRK